MRAQTGSGGVEIKQIVRGDVNVQTGSGSVSLSLPPDAAYSLDAQTGSGSITTSQPLTVQGRVRRNHVTGTVRGGGNTVRVRTGSGSIAIRNPAFCLDWSHDRRARGEGSWAIPAHRLPLPLLVRP